MVVFWYAKSDPGKRFFLGDMAPDWKSLAGVSQWETEGVGPVGGLFFL